MRTLLRLENLMARCLHFTQKDEAADHQAALSLIFEITDVVTRLELKRDLLQHLEKARLRFARMIDNPEVDTTMLADLLNRISEVYTTLQTTTASVGYHIRNNEWLSAIKKRDSLPGGICEFDLPSYHYWANLDSETRRNGLLEWLSPFLQFHEAISLLLHITREASSHQSCMAIAGLYQENSGAYKLAQMLRIHVPKEIVCVPEVIATKHMLQIRFRYPDFSSYHSRNTAQLCEDVSFEINICAL
jgi:cell division protein ZapD